MNALVAMLLIPFAIAGSIGALVAVVWLFILGEWRQVVAGVAAIAVMPMAFALLSAPTLPLVALFERFANSRRRPPALLCLAANSLYTQALLFGWVLAVFLWFITAAKPSNIVPLLLWGYTVVVGPLAYMAKHEQGNSTTQVLLFVCQLLYAALVVEYALGVGLVIYASTAVGVLVVSWVVSNAVAFSTWQESAGTTRET